MKKNEFMELNAQELEEVNGGIPVLAILGGVASSATILWTIYAAGEAFGKTLKNLER